MRHPDCGYSKENRDTVFCQMRRAMDLIHYVVKDGILDTAYDRNAFRPVNNYINIISCNSLRLCKMIQTLINMIII